MCRPTLRRPHHRRLTALKVSKLADGTNSGAVQSKSGEIEGGIFSCRHSPFPLPTNELVDHYLL